jgi:hypothetical protein
MTVNSVHLLCNSSWKCHQHAAEQPLPGRMVRSGKTGGIRTVHHSTKHTWPGGYSPTTISSAERRVGPTLHDNSSSLQRAGREEEAEDGGGGGGGSQPSCMLIDCVHSTLMYLGHIGIDSHKSAFPLVNAAKVTALSLPNFLSSTRAVT